MAQTKKPLVFRDRDTKEKIPFYVKAEDVELPDGTDIETKVGEIEEALEGAADGTVKSVTLNGTKGEPDAEGDVALTMSVPEQVQADWEEDDSSEPAYIKHKPTVDDELDAESGNAIANKTVTAAIAGLRQAIETVLGEGSTTAIENFQEVLDFLAGVTDEETFIGLLNTMNTAISGKVAKSDVYNGLDRTTEGKVLDARQGKALNDLITALQSGKSDKNATVSGVTYDTTSHKLKQTINGTTSDVANVDTAPTANSDNFVTSGGVSTALATLLANISIGNDGYWYIGQTSTGVKAQGPKGNSVVDGDTFDIVNNLTDGGEGDALSAEMGKELYDRLLEVCGGIAYEDTEQTVETTTDVVLTDGHFIRTGQGVGNVCPMTVDSFAGISYATFELKAGDKFYAKGVAGETGNVGMLWAVLDKTTHEILAVHDGVYTKSGSTITVPASETVTVEQDCLVVVNAYNSGANPPYGNSAQTPYSFKKTVYTTETIPVGTLVSGILGDMQDAIDENTEDIEELKNGQYKGLKLAALGDSITWGYTPRNCSGTAGSQLDSFVKLAAQKLGMTFANYGISGSTVSAISGQNRNPMCLRYTDLPNDADVITFMGGVNDVSYNGVLGEMADRGTDTFYGALHTIFQGLYTKYIGGVTTSNGKKKKIIVCTPIKSLDASKLTKTNSIANNADVLLQWDAWIEAIRKVAEFYSFPVLDMYNLSGINPHLDRTIQGTTSWGATGYFNPYITDGVHPTQDGQEIMADLLVGFLKSLK